MENIFCELFIAINDEQIKQFISLCHFPVYSLKKVLWQNNFCKCQKYRYLIQRQKNISKKLHHECCDWHLQWWRVQLSIFWLCGMHKLNTK